MSLMIKTLFAFIYILFAIVMAGVIGIVLHLPDTPFMYALLLLFLLLPLFQGLLKNRL